MKEKNLQVIFGNYLKENPPNETAVYELKMCKGKSMPFSQVAEHQIEALQQAKHGNLYHKITDQPVSWGKNTKMRFTKPKPCDCFNICKANAYIVIVYYKPRQKKEFILIDILQFITERDNSKRKSLTEARAREIADKIIK